MLYDPKWEVKTKPDVFSLESLIAWLETMPRSEEYCYTDSGACVIGQWLLSIDPKMILDGRHSYEYRVFGQISDFQRFRPIANGDGHTFGAALKRARAELTHSVPSAQRGAL